MESKGRGATLERGNAAPALQFLVTFAALVDILLAAGQHEVHLSRELVGDGGVRPWLVHEDTMASDKVVRRRRYGDDLKAQVLAECEARRSTAPNNMDRAMKMRMGSHVPRTLIWRTTSVVMVPITAGAPILATASA